LSVSRTCLYLASRSLPQSSSAERIGLGLVSAVVACVSSAGLLSFGLVSGMAPCALVQLVYSTLPQSSSSLHVLLASSIRESKGASWTCLSLAVLAPRVLLILLAEVVVLDVEERRHVISRRHSRELDGIPEGLTRVRAHVHMPDLFARHCFRV
jgi:hypothetical protein